MKNWKLISLVLFSLVVGFVAQYFWNTPNLGTFLGSDMDPAGNVYVLGVDEGSDKYKISKISSKGKVISRTNLDKSTDTNELIYRNIEVDSSGNIYVVREKRDLEAVTSSEDLYPILSETVLMYDTNGKFVKEVATIDFSEDANPPKYSYIRKLQMVEKQMTIVGCKDYTYEVIKASPLEDSTPEKTISFTIKPSTEQVDKNVEWVNDIAVLSNDRVVYSTKNGQFFAMDNQGMFLDYTNVISRNAMSLVSFSVDKNDNLYFSDAMSGTFYKVNTKSLTPTIVYNIDSVVNSDKEIKVSDLRNIQVIDDGDYYAPSKSFSNQTYIRFGTNNMIVPKAHGAFFPLGLLILVCVAALISGAGIGIYMLFKKGIKRIPLAVRITGMFLPVYIISMGVLLYVVTGDAVSNYTSVLLNDQDLGAKIVVDHINGDEFQSVDHMSDYLTTSYTKLKNQIKEGYSDLASKVGDKSDYIVTYLVKSGKIYSTVNSKYADTSASYEDLKYTNPDMVFTGCVAVEYLLESDEVSTIYDVWNKLSDESGESIVRANFHDVHGELTASFAPIKNTNGDVVGFVGNFMDERIHQTQVFWEILKHSMAVILVVTFFVILYMGFVIMMSLRPLKKIENGINDINRGKWKTRISVPSKDELADIAQSFNLLSEKMDMYTSNLIRLNKEYIRYVPREIFKLMDKSKITDVNVRDYKTLDMNVLNISFNISYKNTYDFADEKELFEALSDSYEAMFKVVEENNGIIQYFDGISAMILFPNSVEDAFSTSLQFKEIEIHEKIKDNMRMILGFGKVLLGITGDENRRGVMLVSDDIMQIFNIDNHMDTKIKGMKLNHIATKDIIDKLGDYDNSTYRFIGRIGDITGEGYVEIYQVIDSINQYKKDLYIKTKELFEEGVKLYIEGEFEKARKILASVVKINEKDYVALQYLDMCDKYMNEGFKSKKWTGYLFN